MGKALLYFRDYWQKVVLIGLLAAGCAVFKNLTFNSVEYLMRDMLQYLNSTENIDKSIVTLNINTFSKYNFKNPHTLETFKKVIDKLQESKPRFILIMMEPGDLLDSLENKRAIFKYFVSQKNVFLNSALSRDEVTSFSKDSIFRSFPNVFTIVLCQDDYDKKKNRREIIYYNNDGPASIIGDLKKFSLNPKVPDFFKFAWNYWETKQAFIKSYKLGTFGYFQTDDLLDNKIQNTIFADKIVIVGTHDEFSWMSRGSIFNTFVLKSEKNMREYVYPIQDIVAGIINFYTTGDYVKLLSSVKDMYIIFFILLVLILVKIPPMKKLYVFLSLIPVILIFEVILYASSSFYIDFSRSVVFLFFIQYFAVPIGMFAAFKVQEQKKLQEVNDARIDSLILVSEKVAHDIRSPLSAINIILSRVKIDNPEYKEIIMNSLKRIDETADKILVKYKSNMGTKSEKFETIGIVELINSIIAEKKIINQKINYIFDNSNTENLDVLGYTLELERILSNILDNSIFALKNKESAPEIVFKLIPKKGFLTIQISDNGIGIPISVLTLLGRDRITTKAKQKGNGIGLLHAKRVIERMNGTFEVTSIEGQKTTISITLPAANHSDTNS